MDIVELAMLICRSRGISDDIVHLVGTVPRTWAVDRRRVEQLLGNLLDNAQKYGGGPTAVRLGTMGALCYLEIDDKGPGASPEDRNTIFDRFVRGRTANSRGTGDGTGLGLALVAQHAAAHDGSAVVLDRPGGCARFRVELGGCTP